MQEEHYKHQLELAAKLGEDEIEQIKKAHELAHVYNHEHDCESLNWGIHPGNRGQLTPPFYNWFIIKKKPCSFIIFFVPIFVDFGVELIYKGKYSNLKAKYEYINFFSTKKFKAEIF